MTAILHLHSHLHHQFAVIQFQNPPVNGLSHATRAAVAAHLATALADPKVTAILITGAGKSFSGGADIKEFGSDRAFAEPTLPALLHHIEQSGKPVIAVLNGVCMGGGLELALACHYRVVARGVQFALPEVKLGLLPGAGGTQRLPRLLPMTSCIEMICEGKSLSSDQLYRLPDSRLFDLLVDEVSKESGTKYVMQAAYNFAASVATQRPLPMTSSRPVLALQANETLIFQQTRQALQKKLAQLPAPLACLDALEASVRGSFADGEKLERELFARLIEGSESKALRHAFIAERAASKLDGVAPDTVPRDIASVAVIGAGTMGTGIAMCFANAGIAVMMLDTQASSLEKGIERIRQTYQTALEKNKLSIAEFEKRRALVRGVSSYDDIAQADLVIEAVFEDMQVKQSVFQQLDAVMKPGAILASNTSTLDLNQIAQLTSRPADVIGLHFFSPANVMPLLEIVRAELTSGEVLLSCSLLAKKIKKVAVVAGVCDGFIGNRMLEQYTKQAAFLLEEGCTPQQVDRAMENFGFAMGPFRMNDLAGNDISWAIRQRRRATNPAAVYSKLGDLLCELGRYGQKTQAGWYDYRPNERTAYSSPIVEQFIKQHAHDTGITQRQISDEEIVQRLVFALANEGRKILRDKIAVRASDIDIVYLKGYGFPAHRGGPMFYAQSLGWEWVDARINEYSLGHRGSTWVLP
ncbi:MAG: enoyl-CoA hydratase/isomerase family protein [Burkholderiales bacterium]|nr:enoyl-CoA hydratase/isomerase family protein [Burkholderiales bacterium]